MQPMVIWKLKSLKLKLHSENLIKSWRTPPDRKNVYKGQLKILITFH